LFNFETGKNEANMLSNIKLTPNWILLADSVYYPLSQCHWWPGQYKAISSGCVGKLAKQVGSDVARIQVEVEPDTFGWPLIKLGYIWYCTLLYFLQYY
jgi:hypothetical protein